MYSRNAWSMLEGFQEAEDMGTQHSAKPRLVIKNKSLLVKQSLVREDKIDK